MLSFLISDNTASTIGTIMAVVAVLLIHMERNAVVSMKPSIKLQRTMDQSNQLNLFLLVTLYRTEAVIISCLPSIASKIQEIFACGIQNLGKFASGIRNPTNDWNPETKFHWQRLESSTWNPESITWNPESKTVLDSLTWGEDIKLLFQTLRLGKFHLGDLLRYLTLCETVTMLPGKYPTISQVNKYK